MLSKMKLAALTPGIPHRDRPYAYAYRDAVRSSSILAEKQIRATQALAARAFDAPGFFLTTVNFYKRQSQDHDYT